MLADKCKARAEAGPGMRPGPAGKVRQPTGIPHEKRIASAAMKPDVSSFGNRLRKTLAHWQKWARRRGIACFRVYGRDVPQFPFVIDRFETIAPRREVHF